MKPIPASFPSFILNNRRMLKAELYTFALNDGSFDYFTDCDIPITYNGNTFKANSLRIEGLKFKIGIGTQVDEQDLKISAFPGDTLAGANFFDAVSSGLLDAAYLTRQRAFWAVNDGRPWVDFQAAPVAVVPLFVGLVSTVDKLGRTYAQIKVKSPLSLCDIDMPRNTYQPGCQWELFSPGCTLSRAAFAKTGTISAVYTDGFAVSGGISPVNGADGLQYYVQGQVVFNSGAQENNVFTIANNGASKITFAYPPVAGLLVGDSFTLSPGCSKIGRGGACELKFNNLNNFRGFPRVPPIMVSA